jgi:hypothetical protein
MKKEDFLKIGLTEEQAEKAAAASAEELKAYVPKGDYDTKVKELETANGSIKDFTGKLKVKTIGILTGDYEKISVNLILL